MGFALEGPTGIEVRQGESASAVFRILATSKPYRNVSLTISGLPSGISAQFLPPSGKPSFNSILTLRTTTTSTVGTFTATILARDAKSSKSMSISVFVVSKGQVIPPSIEPGDIHVATTGNDTTGDGSIGNPYATIQKAHDVASAGDLIYVRGGTYTITGQTTITTDGTSGNYIRLFAYPGETPILDASAVGSGTWNIIRGTARSWWWIKGLEVYGAPGSGIRFDGTSHDMIIENNNCHHNVRLVGNGAGIEFDNQFYNISILNNDCHHQTPSWVGTGGDGIGMYDSQVSGVVIRGNRCWRNNDDGIDCWDSANYLIDTNWCWENGRDDSLNATGGNGMGIKPGGTGNNTDGNHTIIRNLCWRNDEFGINHNSAGLPVIVYNNTTYDNYGGYGFAFDVSPTTVAHVLRNNVAHSDLVSSSASIVHDHNTWDSAVTLTDADFVTLDFTANTGSRQSDGSLPSSDFLKLVSGSDLINAGTQTGLPSEISFLGANPDMGAYERE